MTAAFEDVLQVLSAWPFLGTNEAVSGHVRNCRGLFAQIKHARGFRQFLLRGFAKVRGEWALVCTTHNILKLHRLCL
jgi:hypothetical protein